MVPQQVAEGVAALSVRQAGAVLLAVENDTQCGFSSPDVLAAPEVDGPLGDTGSATWSVEDCVIDVGPEPLTVSSDCNGVEMQISGRVTISARKTLVGRVTGDANTPVIPEFAGAATIEITDAVFEDFVVYDTSSTDHLRTVSGSMSAVIAPQLAAGLDGACSEVTAHVDFPEIVWKQANTVVTSGKHTFDVPVGGGVLQATNGRVGEHENRVAGSLTVWGKPREFTLEGVKTGLNPAYDPETFEASYTCSDTLKLPVTSTCEIESVLAENTARLIIKTFGMLVKTTDQDETCGFGNLEAQADELLGIDLLDSMLWGNEETLVFEANACDVGGDLFSIYENCAGTEFILDGTATVTGTQTVRGQIVLDWPPVHPQAANSAVVELQHVVLDEVAILEKRATASDIEPYLTLHDGTLNGTYHSVTGEAASAPGAYFVKTPVGEFERIRLFDADVTLHNGTMHFPMHVDEAELYALNGTFQGRSNWLSGTITIDGVTWELGEGTPEVLDPEFDQRAFDATYACTENLLEVVPGL